MRNNFAFRLAHSLHNSVTEKLLGNETAKLSFACVIISAAEARNHSSATRARCDKRTRAPSPTFISQQKFDIVKALSRTSINARSRTMGVQNRLRLRERTYQWRSVWTESESIKAVNKKPCNNTISSGTRFAIDATTRWYRGNERQRCIGGEQAIRSERTDDPTCLRLFTPRVPLFRRAFRAGDRGPVAVSRVSHRTASRTWIRDAYIYICRETFSFSQIPFLARLSVHRQIR